MTSQKNKQYDRRVMYLDTCDAAGRLRRRVFQTVDPSASGQPASCNNRAVTSGSEQVRARSNLSATSGDVNCECRCRKSRRSSRRESAKETSSDEKALTNCASQSQKYSTEIMHSCVTAAEPCSVMHSRMSSFCRQTSVRKRLLDPKTH